MVSNNWVGPFPGTILARASMSRTCLTTEEDYTRNNDFLRDSDMGFQGGNTGLRNQNSKENFRL